MLRRALLLFGFVGVVVVVAFGYPDDYHYRQTTNHSRTAVFCYINGTRLMRKNSYQQETPFSLESINVDLCTHLIYGAAILEQNTWKVRAIDSDIETGRSSGNKIAFSDLTRLRNRKRDLKVIISVSASSSSWSHMARQYRETFVQNARTFLGKHNFDGINIDWQYPTRRGGQADDKQNFGLLMKDLKIQLRNEAKLLMTYVSLNREGMQNNYEFTDSVLMDAVDYWIVMATEYYGHAHLNIGANAPMNSREDYSVTKTVRILKELVQHNIYKLILVIPFYGKKYQLNKTLDGQSPFGKALINKGAPPESVTLSYREICLKMNSEPEWARDWDRLSETPYIVKDRVAILYDDADSVARKTSLALRSGWGGVMAFSIDMDDFDGKCSDSSPQSTSSDYSYNARDRNARQYPLLQSVYDTVERGPNSAGLRSSPLALVLAVVGVALLKVFG